MTVFVLDRHKKPLMPCSEKRARHLLQQKRAVVHRLVPFTIRLKDRSVQESTLQPVVLKIDPGSRTTGMALAREEPTEAGPVHHALHLAQLDHRGEAVHQAMQQRAGYRRLRRSANLRYREPRFLNRARFGIAKTHALDALCVGDLAGVDAGSLRTLRITAQGRGSYQRTNVDESGFPRGYLMRQKRVRQFQTGDLVCAVVPAPLKTAGVHRGRVTVRATGKFRMGKIDGINANYCRMLQRADGYSYGFD